MDLFAGEIAPFLEQGEVVFGGVSKLLDEQYTRLADLEQTVLRWMAIARKPVTLAELCTVVLSRYSGKLLEALYRLRCRSLIEHGQHPGSFTLPSVMQEYMTMQFGDTPQDRAETACAPDPARMFSDSLLYGLCGSQPGLP